MKKYILGLLVLVLLCLGFAVWGQYRGIQAQHVVPNFAIAHRRGAATVSDAAYIQPWMTFEYLDFAYKLPPAYLQLGLNITDAQYPRISIQQYAATAGIDPAVLTGQVISLVQSYITVSGVSTSTADSASN